MAFFSVQALVHLLLVSMIMISKKAGFLALIFILMPSLAHGSFESAYCLGLLFGLRPAIHGVAVNIQSRGTAEAWRRHMALKRDMANLLAKNISVLLPRIPDDDLESILKIVIEDIAAAPQNTQFFGGSVAPNWTPLKKQTKILSGVAEKYEGVARHHRLDSGAEEWEKEDPETLNTEEGMRGLLQGLDVSMQILTYESTNHGTAEYWRHHWALRRDVALAIQKNLKSVIEFIKSETLKANLIIVSRRLFQLTESAAYSNIKLKKTWDSETQYWKEMSEMQHEELLKVANVFRGLKRDLESAHELAR